ncbi:MAG: GNAT family N-acetyltransferase [Alphaproteobacteria bacterium]
MHVETIETAARLIEIELDWDELYRRDPSATVFLSSRFLTSIAFRAMGKFRILVAWSDDRTCLGAFPLFVKTRWSKSGNCLYNELDMLGHVFDADYTGILCDPDHEVAVCEAFAREIQQMSFGLIVLSYFAGPAGRLKTFCSAFDPERFAVTPCERKINDGKTNNLLCPSVDLPDSFSTYLASLSTNSRQKLRRLLRQLDSDPELRITRSRPETFPQDVALLSELWYLQYAEHKGAKRAAKLTAQFREIIMVGLANGLIYLAVLWRAGKPVAAQANYVDPVKGHALFHVGGRDETVRDLPVGLMLQAHCIRWSIAQGLTRYDFTLGNEPYKYSFGAVDREIGCVEIATLSGTNTTGRLDETSRDDVAEHIRRYVRRGRNDDARMAARQALQVWPDLEIACTVEALIAEAQAKGR